jgi:hypothetical protein
MTKEVAMKTSTKLVHPTPELSERVVAICEYPQWCVKDGTHTCAPDDIEPVRKYALVILKSDLTDDGAFWDALLYRDGVAILEVSNDGDGGPNKYFPAVGHRANWDEYVDTLKADAQKAFPRDKYELEDVLMGYLDMIANAV